MATCSTRCWACRTNPNPDPNPNPNPDPSPNPNPNPNPNPDPSPNPNPNPRPRPLGPRTAGNFFHDVHELYVKVLMNPFHEFNTPIASPLFDARVKVLGRKYF